ncbi:hypothetical protein [Niallia circulans]|uniref:Uncharacterized protein n=1 Tax=Niallia circulans TaxID=1397 RepID=A0A941JHH7_NIACI|nr:hypothetical protein [Niallia circulans]MCB5239121.1 hypothetical protein [Niallia circulans]
MEERTIKNNPSLLTLYEMDKNFIKYNLSKERAFHFPTKNGLVVIESSELCDWIIEVQTKEELREMVMMIRKIKRRKAPIRPLLITIGIGLTSIYENEVSGGSSFK